MIYAINQYPDECHSLALTFNIVKLLALGKYYHVASARVNEKKMYNAFHFDFINLLLIA